MSGKKRTFSKELKTQIISEAEAGVSIAELNRRYELSHGMIAKWRIGTLFSCYSYSKNFKFS